MALLQAILDDQDAAVQAAWKAESAGDFETADSFKALAVHLEREAADVLRNGVS